MRFFLSAAVSVIVCHAATAIADKPPEERLLGAWTAGKIESNYDEFKGATNFAFYVYRIEVLSRNRGERMWASVVGEFVVKDARGKEKLPYICFPMYLSGTNRLVAGPMGEALVFSYLIDDDDTLSLQITEGPYFFKARLQKIGHPPKEPRFLPDWAK